MDNVVPIRPPIDLEEDCRRFLEDVLEQLGYVNPTGIVLLVTRETESDDEDNFSVLANRALPLDSIYDMIGAAHLKVIEEICNDALDDADNDD